MRLQALSEEASKSIKAFAKAKEAKDDEWYTRLEDIEKEITEEYFPFFKGKRVFLPCDDYRKSNFSAFFRKNFDRLELESVTSIGIEGFCEVFDKNGATITPCNGDFRGKFSLNMLRNSDIVITNPPFSLLATFFSIISGSGKQFLLIMPSFSFHYASVFKLLQKKLMWVGKTGEIHMKFQRGDGFDLINVCWATNIPYTGYIRELPLAHGGELPRCFDGTNIPNFDKIKDVPDNYFGLMAVPVSIFRYNPLNQFAYHKVVHDVKISGKNKFSRIVVSRIGGNNA